jgi:hypothetical protein
MGRIAAGLCIALGAAALSCAPKMTSYVHPEIDLGFIRRAAILPFENLSADGFADERMHSLFSIRVLRKEALEIVEPGAVLNAMAALGLPTGTTLSPEEYVSLGARLGVDGLFFGRIEEYGISRQNRQSVNEVTAVFGLVETQTGVVVWQAQVNVRGQSFTRKLFGLGSRSLHDVSSDAVDEALGTLF